MKDSNIPHYASLMMQQGSEQRHGLLKTHVMHGGMAGSWLMGLWFHYMHALHSMEMCSLTASQIIQ
jgi:hypothetical protein